MLTAEKTHLLLTRADGRSESPAHHGIALSAAALADLREAGMVRVEDAPVASARLWVVAGGTAGDPVLDGLLPGVDALSGEKVSAVVAKGRPAALKPVAAHLVETGELEEHKAFLTTRRVPVTTSVKDGLTSHLTAVVLDEADPTAEDILLLGILQHLNLARRLLPGAHERYDRREFTRRIEALTRSDLLVQAVRAAVAGRGGAIAATAAGVTSD